MISSRSKLNYIYIAGPYDKGDTVQNIRNAITVANELVTLGFTPYVPHLDFIWHAIYPHNVAYWMKWNNMWLLKCDALLLLQGYSVGATEEVKVAHKNKIPVFRTMDSLLTAAIESASKSDLSVRSSSEPHQDSRQG